MSTRTSSLFTPFLQDISRYQWYHEQYLKYQHQGNLLLKIIAESSICNLLPNMKTGRELSEMRPICSVANWYNQNCEQTNFLGRNLLDKLIKIKPENKRGNIIILFQSKQKYPKISPPEHLVGPYRWNLPASFGYAYSVVGNCLKFHSKYIMLSSGTPCSKVFNGSGEWIKTRIRIYSKKYSQDDIIKLKMDWTQGSTW